MRVRQAIEDYRFAILHLSHRTQDWYMQRLSQFADWCENTSFHDGIELSLEAVTVSVLRRYLDYLSKRGNWATGRIGKPLSSYTIHGHARILRTFLNWCSVEDGLEKFVSEKTPRKMTMPKVDEVVIEVFSPEQVKAMFAASEREYSPALNYRDKAILSLLLDTGIRAHELTTLTLDNVHLNANDTYIMVMGKGRKEREVGLGNAARTALHKYISRYRKSATAEKHVFLSRFSKGLTVSGLDQILYRLGEWAKVEEVRVSAHTFRHTFAVSYLKNGGDVFKLSRLLGHSSVQTTMIYLKAFNARDAREGGKSVLDNL